jgi:hypothetical protein
VRPQSVGRPFEQDDSPEEFAGWGGGLLAEPTLKITFPDGNRDLVLHFVSSQATAHGLTIVLKDIQRDVFVTLHYAMDAQTGILGRWAEIENRAQQPFVVEQAESAEWNLPRSSDYVLHYLTGRWGGEDQFRTRALQPGRNGAGKPAWFYRRRICAVVRDRRKRSRDRASRHSVVRFAGVERLVAHHGGTGSDATGEDRWRLQPVRFRLQAGPGQDAGDPGVLRRSGAARVSGNVAAGIRLPVEDDSSAGAAPAFTPCALQLLGGDGVQL